MPGFGATGVSTTTAAGLPAQNSIYYDSPKAHVTHVTSISFCDTLTGPSKEDAPPVGPISTIGGPVVGPPLTEAMEVAPVVIFLTPEKGSTSKSLTKGTSSLEFPAPVWKPSFLPILFYVCIPTHNLKPEVFVDVQICFRCLKLDHHFIVECSKEPNFLLCSLCFLNAHKYNNCKIYYEALG